MPSDPSSARVHAATPDAIARAAGLIRAGRLVAFPTETVYGLGADATQGEAVAAIYAAKGRPRFNPLIAHVAEAGDIDDLVIADPLSRRLAEAFWPGPLTLVLPLRPGSRISTLATAGHDTLAVRLPSHPVARALIAAAGTPVVAPSANRSGHVSPSTARHVADDLGDRVPMILDGGPTEVGVESTIVQVRDGRLLMLRPGGVARAAIEAVAGMPAGLPAADEADAPVAPGMLSSHYAPEAAVRLDAVDVAPGEAVLTFAGQRLAGDAVAALRLDLSPAGSLAEAAANLFALLRDIDAAGVASIAVAPIPADGIGEAIRDRLARAAAPRR